MAVFLCEFASTVNSPNPIYAAKKPRLRVDRPDRMKVIELPIGSI